MGRTHTSQTEAGVKLLMVTRKRKRGSRVEGTSALLSRTMSVPVNPLRHLVFPWHPLYSHPTAINLGSA